MSAVPIVLAYPLADVRWLEVSVAPWGVSLKVPHYVAPWDSWRCWEAERFNHMKEHLCPGNVLFDVGAETGWQSAVLAKLVGGENMVLFEPSTFLWSCIHGLWKHNDLKDPCATFCGFVGDKSTEHRSYTNFLGWPEGASSVAVVGHDASSNFFKAYRHLDNAAAAKIPITTLDDFCDKTGIVPDALNIDVEGSEFQVLAGATDVLKKRQPLVWLSFHPDSALAHGTTLEVLLDFMKLHGYKGFQINVDHEQHWFFSPDACR